MKRCPTCQRTYEDATLRFCLQDGAILEDPTPAGPVTANLADQAHATDPPTEVQATNRLPAPPDLYATAGPRQQSPPPPNWQSAPLPPPPVAHKRSWLPWVLGGGAVVGLGLIGLLAVGLIMASRMSSQPTVVVNTNSNATRNSNRGFSANSNPAANANSAMNANTSDPAAGGDDIKPVGDATGDEAASDDAATLQAQLIALENDWIRANIKADKSALEQILADEFTGTTDTGQVQNKEEYLATIEPDPSVISWSSDDVRLNNSGNTAVLTGVLIWKTRRGTQRFRFTDTFVHRSGRWQALSSQVSPAS